MESLRFRTVLCSLLIAATAMSNALGATGNLVAFDDADENGFNRAAATCTTNSFLEPTVVHSGSAAIAISKGQDNNGAGWLAPATYSASADYDAISFWVNAGSSSSTLTSLAVFDATDTPHFLHLETLYGGPLPANQWIGFVVPFASDFFAAASSTPPETVKTICLISHTVGAEFLFLDDVALRGADIFKDSFDTCTVCAPGLVISQVQTRGDAGASDELVELYNPTGSPVIFDNTWTLQARSSTSANYTSRAIGAGQSIPAHGHILFGGSLYNGPVSADATLTSGITDATSLVLQHNGNTVDALCFYYDATTQAVFSSGYTCEGTPISNLPHDNTASGTADVDVSLERKPGGASGNTQNTGDNAFDFNSNVSSDPHNLASPAVP